MPKGFPKNGVNKGWFKKGFKHSEETKEKISQNNAKYWLGRELSAETRKKSSKSHKGYIVKEETKKKLREIAIRDGHGKWMKGKKLTKEHRENIGKAIEGEKSCHWKGGVTSENLIIRTSAKYRAWRRRIFKRDNWTCKKCLTKGRDLNAHHIKNFSTNNDDRFKNENGITFCKKCHDKFHKIYTRKNNNIKQVEEFLKNK